jgi:hypothetical protein
MGVAVDETRQDGRGTEVFNRSIWILPNDLVAAPNYRDLIAIDRDRTRTDRIG